MIAAEPASVKAAGASLVSCKLVGPIGCDMTPRPRSELCQPSVACLRPTDTALDFDELAIQCDVDLAWNPLEAAFSKREPAPSGSGVTATMLVNLRSTKDSISMFDASFLVAEFTEGSCLVDIAHGWEMSRLVRATTARARWETAPDGFHLYFETDRVLYDEPDEGQGEDEPHCERLSYLVEKGQFTRLGRESIAGHCPSTDASKHRG